MDRFHLATNVVFPILLQPHGYRFAREAARGEQHSAIRVAAHRLAAKGDVSQLGLDARAFCFRQAGTAASSGHSVMIPRQKAQVPTSGVPIIRLPCLVY